MSTLVVGRAGSYVNTLRRTAAKRLAVAGTIVAGAVWFVVARLDTLVAGGPRALVVVVAAACGVAAAASLSPLRTKLAKASVGYRAERRVGAALERVGPAAVLHSVVLGAGGDVDHIVLGPVVAVVETKHGSGEVVYVDGRLHAGRRQLRGDPVAQARRQALALRETVGCFVDAIVCVVDMSNATVSYGNVYVCSAAALPGLVSSLQHRVERDTARAWALDLADGVSVVERDAPMELEFDPRAARPLARPRQHQQPQRERSLRQSRSARGQRRGGPHQHRRGR